MELTLRMSRRNNIYNKVVILTSSIEENEVIASYKTGANSYVCKPIDFKDFTEGIKLLGLYWLIWNKPAPAHS
ncbi:MAG: hypothetical protein ACLQBQ_01690 [Smithella sp.]